ncbi:hypothetical protein SAMN04489761_0159 [Tenacibaculum sp. MAR_2009_124]|uniref:alpha/beta hydrolase-fold protein n=1 Tax=Tenacibaculum sp. MAR_2009_124 TaxID=1250059 RepID=UPI00089CDB35|nr:alpha/beta hydrolase-fold protein [Tenacibaculum sp. MAR_2009_124]SEB36456.1 hypothetical protein SAMN04489761_0159 [Tenacibaculum sp. MAR_2009_124]
MKFTFLSVFILFTSVTIFAQNESNLVSIGKKHNISSKVLDETRNYYVYLPTSYKTSQTKKYIVVYVLDGNQSKFHEVTGIVQSMNSISNLKMQIPEVIVVAIENTDRVKNFTPTNSLNYLDRENILSFSSSGGANDFMSFIENELMPHINSIYRTIGKNMIIGHSLGGLFGLHVLLENPTLFQYYILIDPSWFWDHNYIGKRAKSILPNKSDLNASVYTTLANNFAEDERHFKWGQEFYQLLENSNAPNLRTKIKYFEDEKHLTVPLPSTYKGFRFIFDGFEISDFNEIFKDPTIINTHYNKFSKQLGVTFTPDESYVNTLGYIALRDRNLPEIAKSIFKINSENHPLSLNVWDSLADAFKATGDVQEAKKCYRKILSIDSGNVHAKNELKKLK